MATADITVPKYVEKNTLRRIISDVREIRKNPLTAHGIHYEHDETDMMHGKALIIGPSETPYADGFYLFKIKFPTNYPHAPPTVDFCTSDGYTRFNPNLYRSGKVCLSILNTWRGEPWSGCQTLSSVLLAICTVLNAEPLLNEPGVLKIHVDFDKYNAILQYKNIEVAIFGVLQKLEEQQEAYEFAMFGPIMREHFLSVKEKIRQKVAAEAEAEKNKEPNSVTVIMYKMTVVLDYQGLVGKF